MAVVIRFKRTGAKGRPFYRVVVADSRYPRDGRFIQQLGYYDPLTDPATFKVDEEQFAKWMRTGATPSESVSVLMAKHAPGALRPAPLPKAEAAPAAPRTPRKAAAKKAAKKPAAKKKAAAKRPDKKAKARAKAKAGKGASAKPKAAKKSKK